MVEKKTGTVTFESYSSVYDLLYQDKDYQAEAGFLEKIFDRYAASPPHTILDLGCGSGGHAFELIRRGYQVTGVDRSKQMLALANKKALQIGVSVEFLLADIRSLELERTFDAVTAMFAVMSYQTSNKDLVMALQAARRHLRPGGLFVFDCWFGPAVLAQRPIARHKVVEDGDLRVIRFASPVLDLLSQTVRVDYKVIRIKGGRLLDEIEESHLMRFLFPQEFGYLLEKAGFQLTCLCPFMNLEGIPTEQDWNVTVIATACD